MSVKFVTINATGAPERAVKEEVRANHHDPTPWNVYTVMNLYPPTPKGGLHRSLRVISLLLIQHALVPLGTDAHAHMRLPSNPENDRNDAGSRPYLRVSGNLPLRFAAAPRPIPLLAVKAAATPEITHPLSVSAPSPSSTETSVAHSVAPVAEVKDVTTPEPTVETSLTTTPANDKSVPSILPDDTHPSTRAEDFLPFFQFPSGKDVTVVVPASAAQAPAPGHLPASSATYQQR